MSKINIIMVVFMLTLLNQGCRWRDDFRDRQQPQMLEEPLRPTLNRESDDYIIDDTNLEKEIERDTPLHSIDAVSPIPKIRAPEGM